MRIAFVCDGIAEFTAGSIVSARRFALLLKGRGHQCIFIAGRAPGHPVDDYWEGMKVYRFPSFLLPKTDEHFFIGLPLPSQIERILKEECIDFVYVIIPPPSAWATIRAAKKLNLPVVVHSHTQPENLFLNAMHTRTQWLSRFLSASLYIYLRQVYAKADAIFFPSEFSRRLFRGLPPAMRIEVISNGVDTAKFKPRDREEICRHFKLDPAREYLLYVGRLHPEKRVDTFIGALPEIVKERPNAHALIVGGGHRESSLKKLSQHLHMQNHITFLGFLSDEDVEKVYGAADIFVLPSMVELEGMVVLQAIASGNALLVADSPTSASPYLVQGNGKLFVPGDSHDLARKALEMLGNRKKLEEMKARSLVLAPHYDIHQSCSKIEDVFLSLLKK